MSDYKDLIKKIIIGKRQKQALLTEALFNIKSELVAIYGRRRVGKTPRYRQIVV